MIQSLNNYFETFTHKLSFINYQVVNNTEPKIFSLVKYLLSEIASEPLHLIAMIIFVIFTYLYFASQIICQIFGLYLPIVYFYQKFYSIKNGNIQEIEPIVHYFVAFMHLELISSITSLFNLYFYHLKLLSIVMLIYFLIYREELLRLIYEKILFYDKQILSFIMPYLPQL